MQLIHDWKDLQFELAMKRHNVSKSCTNFFPDQNQFNILIHNRKISVLHTEYTIWVFRQDRGFQHVYYSTYRPDQLSGELYRIKPYLKKPTTITVINTAQQIGNVDKLFCGIGFYQYSEFMRFVSTKNAFLRERSEQKDVVLAKNSDATAILDLFTKVFDPIDDEIPSLEEIFSYILKQNVFIVKDGQNLAGCLIKSDHGLTSYFLYIAVDELYRGRRIASELMHKYLNECMENNILRRLLWVRKTNLNAISFHNHYGFRADGLEKKIFYSKGIS